MTCVLIVDDDPAIGLGLAAALEREGRRIIVCRDLESAQIILAAEPVTDIVTDVKLSDRSASKGWTSSSKSSALRRPHA